jgi:hypothetical protein|tara:strand:+ start:132 stop:491 length:360 start_codon:yes stop_codon:yes gene_type:complete
MEKLLETISLERQERLLNPQTSDHFETFMFGKYGRRLYQVKVGRKWVFMRSRGHRARITLQRFKNIAYSQWKRDASTDASTQVYKETGVYKRKRGWWKHYGFEENPLKVKLSVRDTLWK